MSLAPPIISSAELAPDLLATSEFFLSSIVLIKPDTIGNLQGLCSLFWA